MSTDNISFIWRGKTRSFDPYVAFLVTIGVMIVFPIIGILGLEVLDQASSVLIAIVTYLFAVLITFVCMCNPNLTAKQIVKGWIYASIGLVVGGLIGLGELHIVTLMFGL